MTLFPPTRHPHLTLVREEVNLPRRTRPFPPPSSGPRNRAETAQSFLVAIDRMEQEVKNHRPPSGVQPHLVFRVPIKSGMPYNELADKLHNAGLTVVSIEPDKAIIAFQSEADLTQFRQAVESYRVGPRDGINPTTNKPYASTQWDLLESVEVEEMRLWGRDDRIGPQLRKLMVTNGNTINPDEFYKVDVELWHRGTQNLGQAALEEIRRLVQDANIPRVANEGVLDHYVGSSLCLARVAFSGARLTQLLEMDIVAMVEIPPRPNISASEIARTTTRDFPAPPPPPPDGPRLCVIDSGITSAHPLLSANVGFEEAILTRADTVADQHGHGTRVAGLAVFGDIRACYEHGAFASPITLYSARVLNENNEFDDDKLIITQIKNAVETFYRPPYHCRVFNLSINSYQPWVQGQQRQPLWSEALDNISRDYKVLFVVSSGNRAIDTLPAQDDRAEIIANSYPQFLMDAEARLSEPATAALAVTVGAIAQHDVPSQGQGPGRDDIVRPIARLNQPAPFTRSGPGILEGVKPEFVDYGGNSVFKGVGNMRHIGKDDGTSIMSFAREPTQRLFSFDIGSSYAAPRVARIAALTWHELATRFGAEPHPNLVRAVMATAASTPPEALECIETTHGRDQHYKVCGYGKIDEFAALNSTDTRVLLCAQGEVQLDHFAVFQVPIPPEIHRANGKKKIIVALAFDPPVRGRRFEYLGAEMAFELVRGKPLDDVLAAYRQVAPDERAETAIESRYKVDLTPHGNLRVGCSRKRSTLQRAECVWQRQQIDYGETWYLVVRAERKWAPLDIQSQSFAVALVITAEQPDLYNLIEQRVRRRVRGRARR